MNSTPSIASRGSGLVDMLLASLSFSFIGVCVIESQAPAFEAAFFRCLFAALSLALYCLLRGDIRRRDFRGSRLAIMVVGGLLMAVTWWVLFKAYELTSISVATLMFNTQPFFTLIVGSLVFREALTAKNIIWTIVAFGGILLVSGAGGVNSGDADYIRGALFAIGAALLYCVTSLISKQIKAVKPHVQVLVQVTVAGLVIAPLLDLHSGLPSGAALGWLAALGVLCTSAGYIALYSAYRKLPISQLAVLSFAYPALTVVVDYLIYGTVLSIDQIFGIAIVVVSSLNITRRQGDIVAPLAPVPAFIPEPPGKVSYRTIAGREQGSRIGLVFRENPKTQLLQLLAIHRRGKDAGGKAPVVITGKHGDLADAVLAAQEGSEGGH